MARPKDNAPQQLETLAKGLFQRSKKTPHLALNRLKGRWPSIVGAELGGKTMPARLERGQLTIHAPDAGWAYNLRFMEAELLENIRAFLDGGEIKSLRFIAGPVQAAPGQPPAQPPTPYVPDPQVAAGAQAIADPKLRDKFVRAFSKQKAARLKRQEHSPAGAASLNPTTRE